jgi:hypothetical protein
MRQRDKARAHRRAARAAAISLGQEGREQRANLGAIKRWYPSLFDLLPFTEVLAEIANAVSNPPPALPRPSAAARIPHKQPARGMFLSEARMRGLVAAPMVASSRGR